MKKYTAHAICADSEMKNDVLWTTVSMAAMAEDGSVRGLVGVSNDGENMRHWT